MARVPITVEGNPVGSVAERILTVRREPFHLPGHESTPIRVSASIGIVVGDRDTADDLLRDADVALYQAKGAGKDRYVVFVPGRVRTPAA